mgnify:FL=1
MNTKKDRLSHRLSDVRCESCDEEFDIRRYELGYNFCLSCGDVLARSVVRTVVPLHKSNYVLVTNRDELKGINNKCQPS